MVSYHFTSVNICFTSHKFGRNIQKVNIKNVCFNFCGTEVAFT